MLGGFDGVVSDFNATAVAALAGGEEGVLGLGGGAEVPGVGAGTDGRHPPPEGAAGFGGTDGEVDAGGFGATDVVAGPGATDANGFGATEVLASGAAAAGAREGIAAAGRVSSGGAGIDVRPVAGPGPGGAAGCTGMVAAGAGGASSRQTRASASKLRIVLRPQMGQSHPTSNRFSCASMLCAGARSRTRSEPIAKPART
ncbi:MAG TPA: hypothetical protein VK550_02550 [Polyangiaceae bacterium]|nr:hypothetical protein [Polyangiaceae bacterium]